MYSVLRSKLKCSPRTCFKRREELTGLWQSVYLWLLKLLTRSIAEAAFLPDSAIPCVPCSLVLSAARWKSMPETGHVSLSPPSIREFIEYPTTALRAIFSPPRTREFKECLTIAFRISLSTLGGQGAGPCCLPCLQVPEETPPCMEPPTTNRAKTTACTLAGPLPL